jgi:hypothetical protein
VEHSYEAALRAVVDGLRPSVAAYGLLMIDEVKDLHKAIPRSLTLEGLFDTHSLYPRGVAAV